MIPVTEVPTGMLPVRATLSDSSSMTSSSLSSVYFALDGCGIKLCYQQNKQTGYFLQVLLALSLEERVIFYSIQIPVSDRTGRILGGKSYKRALKQFRFSSVINFSPHFLSYRPPH